MMEMMVKRPKNNCNSTKCMAVAGWISVRGVSNEAADMNNFKYKETDNVTVEDLQRDMKDYDFNVTEYNSTMQKYKPQA